MGRPRKGLNGYKSLSKDFMAHNKTVITVGCKQFIEEIAKPKLIRMLTQIAEAMRDFIDGTFEPFYEGGNEGYPVWTGQMHDATGVAIYNNGAIIKFLPTKKAVIPQSDFGVNNIIGSEWLERAISEASQQCSNGLWIVLFSSVPYAGKINSWGSKKGRGAYYFDRLTDKELGDILFNLEMDPMFELRKE